MKKLLVPIFFIVFSFSMASAGMTAYAKPQAGCMSQSEVKFKNDFRRLWVDHVLWTSNYITSATTGGAEDQQQVLARLLRNQEDIGNAIKPVYGAKAGAQLTNLLKEHIVIAGKIVDAAKIGNQTLANQLNTEWYRNADEIAAFLSSANPYLKKEVLKNMLQMHLKLVADDLSASLSKDWEGRIVSIDDGLSHIILMADTISSGVVKQFPQKFK